MANGDQYLYDSQELSINLWDVVNNALPAVKTGIQGPNGGYFHTITSPQSNSYVRQNIINPNFSNKSFNIQTSVEPGTGTNTSLFLWFLNTNTSLAQYIVAFNLSANSSSVTSGSILASSNIITTNIDGTKQISFTASAPLNANRCIVGLHYGGTGGTVKYADVNLQEWNSTTPPPYSVTTNIHSSTPPSDWLDNIGSDVFNPVIPASFAVYDCGEIADHTFNTTTLVSNLSEFQAALTAAQAAPTQKHKINWTVNNIAIDINQTLTADFITAGGLLLINTANGEPLVNTGQLRLTGGKGCAWFNYHTEKTFNLYDMEARTETIHYGVYITNGNWCFKDFKAGKGFTANTDPMHCCIAMYYSATDATSTLLLKRVFERKTNSAFRGRGIGRLVIDDILILDTIEDEIYRNSNASAGSGNTVSTWVQNAYTGIPASFGMVFLACNTRAESWATGAIYPFVEGEIVTQTNPAGVFRGRVKYIFEGDGVNISPRLTLAPAISGVGLGWRGDVVYIDILDPESETYMRQGYPVIGQTSGTSFTPVKTVTTGASSGHDSGNVLGLLHTDALQWGAANDDTNTTYQFGLYNINSILSCPLGGETQGAVNNAGPGAVFKFHQKFADIAITAVNAAQIQSGNCKITKSTHTVAPLGTAWERAHQDPLLFGLGVPKVVVSNALQNYSNAPIVEDVISGERNVVDTVRINAITNNDDWYPYLYSTKACSANATTGITNYETLFGTTLERYSDNYVIEKVPVVPYNAPFNVAKKLITNWFDLYRCPVALGGWDYTTNLSGTGLPPKGFFGKVWNAGRIPHIRFSEFWDQQITVGDAFVPPAFTATDGVTDLTSSVIVNVSGVSFDTPGIYYPQYLVTNSDGNTYETYSILTILEGGTSGGGGGVSGFTNSLIDNLVYN